MFDIIYFMVPNKKKRRYTKTTLYAFGRYKFVWKANTC